MVSGNGKVTSTHITFVVTNHHLGTTFKATLVYNLYEKWLKKLVFLVLRSTLKRNKFREELVHWKSHEIRGTPLRNTACILNFSSLSKFILDKTARDVFLAWLGSCPYVTIFHDLKHHLTRFKVATLYTMRLA
jgi:hypothetical protein